MLEHDCVLNDTLSHFLSQLPLFSTVWNLPFNGVSVAMGGITVDKIVEDPGLRQLADLVMDETISVANADLKHHGEMSIRLGDDDKKKMFDLSDNMGPYSKHAYLMFILQSS
jgi:ketopantoate reductase